MREVPRSEWAPFLDRLAGRQRAWLARVERAGAPDRERPLAGATAEEHAQGTTSICVRFADSGESLRIEEAATLRVQEEETGAVRAIEIADARGEAVRLSFRSAPAPELLDGLAPGEAARGPSADRG